MIAGAAGIVLIVMLFLPWVSIEGVDNLSGWQLFIVGDIFFLITGLVGIAAALAAGGRLIPGLSWGGAAALLGSVATILLLWLLIFDWPDGTSRMLWVFIALVAAAGVAFGGFTSAEDERTA
jgi:hypothetical protein